MSVLIRLSQERGEQLRTYAQAQGFSVTQAIGALLKSAGAASTVPGFDFGPMRLVPGGKAVAYTLRFDGFSALLTAENAERVASYLDHCADTPGTGGHEVTLSIEGKDVALLTIARHRRHSIIIAGKRLPDGESVTRVLTLDLAQDLAEQMRRAVA